MEWFILCVLVFHAVALPIEEDSVVLGNGFDENYPEENPGLFEGDIDLRPGENPNHRNAIVGQYHYWPGGVIPYAVDSHYAHDSTSKGYFQSAMQEIMNKTTVNGKSCVTFVPRTNEKSYIQFTYGSGCHTPIGMLHSHRSDVTLGHGCLRHGTIIHEILHALGFWHEQSRADRDQYVTINFNNIQTGHEGNFRKYTEGVQIDHLGMPYDYGSVMHYDAYAFAKDRHTPTIIPKQHGAKIGQRIKLSDQDAEEVKILYGCMLRPSGHGSPTTHAPHGQPTTAVPHPTVHHITATPHPVTNRATTCSFDGGLCGWTQATNDTLNWTLHAGKTQSSNTGPHADHTGSTTAHYLYLEASRHLQKTAVLTSPTYPAGQNCFRVWYNMNGNEIGYLKFYFLHSGVKTLMRTVSGNHHDVWYHSTFSVRSGHPIQFEIEGHTGSSYHSDIAIDDISVTPGGCTH